MYKIQRNISGVTEYAAMKVIPVPKEPSETQDLLNSGYDPYSINQRYRADLEDIRKEYSMMALLKGNANVVYCDDICDEPNPDGIGWTLYIRMELLTPLTKALEEPCSEAQVVKVGMDLCNALAACKRKNIIHRDIKPANIMVAEDGNYKLGDFGVAKRLEGTSGGTKTGTYNFMAPEVYNNRPYGHSVDIYSLGMVMYWMLNRRCMPFLPLPPVLPTASLIEMAKEHRFSGAPLPKPEGGSPALQKIVLRACAFDPAQRYSTPEELYAALSSVSVAKQEPAKDEEPDDFDKTWDDVSKKTDNSAQNTGEKKFDQNSWESEYDKTDGSVYGRDMGDSGTVGDPKAGGASKMGPMDVRGTVSVTAQELASGCVKRVVVSSIFDGIVMESAMRAQTGSAASTYAKAAAKTAAKTVDITIPAGTKAGAVLRLNGAGRVDSATGARGNAYITVKLADGNSDDFWGAASGKNEKKSTYSGVISTGKARNGGAHQFKFKDGSAKAVQIPAGCKDGQIVDGVKIYVHDFSTKVTNMRDLPDAVLEMYANHSLGVLSGTIWMFVLWTIFGVATMMIPVMAVGLVIHFVYLIVRTYKRNVVITEARNILQGKNGAATSGKTAAQQANHAHSDSKLNPSQVQQIKTLVSSGNTLAAVKVYREATGAALAEAKAAVEKIATQTGRQ